MYRVYRVHSSTGALAKLAHLALLGVGILFLGPIALTIAAVILAVVVAVLGTALPFILVGALAYVPYRWVRRKSLAGRQPSTADVRRVAPPQPLLRPIALARPVEHPPQPQPERRRGSVVKRVIGEVLSGAIVGALLGAVVVVGPPGDWQTGTLVNYLALGSGIGAIVGFIVGGPRPAKVEKTPMAS
jgi:hypothetical protein